MTVGIDRNTTDPVAWGEALALALSERPEQVMNADALAGWFATAIEAGRRSASAGVSVPTASHVPPSPEAQRVVRSALRSAIEAGRRSAARHESPSP